MLKGAPGCSEQIGGAPYAEWAPVQPMGVNHCGAHVTVAEQFLDGADVCPTLQQVGGKRVSEGVAARRLCHPRGHHGPANLFLND